MKKICSISDFINSLKDTPLTNGEYIFRGQINSEWEIKPTFLRVPKTQDHFLIECAYFFLLYDNKIIPYATTFDPIEYLSIIQHFGVPTRLLDWTYDALVALFFACFDYDNKYEDKDGIVIALNKNHYKSINLRTTNTFNKGSFDEIDKKEFWGRLNIDDIHFVDPFFKCPRARAQNGCFMFFPFHDLRPNENKYFNLKEYVLFRNEFIRKESEENNTTNGEIFYVTYNVEASCKKKILEELELFSINSEYLLLSNSFHVDLDDKYKDFYEFAINDHERVKTLYQDFCQRNSR